MRDTSFAFFRSLWKSAKSTPNRSAIDVALFVHRSMYYQVGLASVSHTASRHLHLVIQWPRRSNQNVFECKGLQTVLRTTADNKPEVINHVSGLTLQPTLEQGHQWDQTLDSLVNWNIKKSLYLRCM